MAVCECEVQQQQQVTVIQSWSFPRSFSTSLMYSFAQRDDVEVLDEPLYAHFLRVSGLHTPYRDQLLSKMEPDGNKVVKDIISSPGSKKYRFCKESLKAIENDSNALNDFLIRQCLQNISKHKVLGLSEDLMKNGKHFILIRNPLDILSSFENGAPPSFSDLGLVKLVCIYNELYELGKPPPVIDAAELQQDPEIKVIVLYKSM
ncbi:hypothetical protein PIB30_070768 [Stylosanthes scabra]|uniref:Sulfotransferase n=1 Tax=Stylosanthes scabra TaxID=79078 RepID=A0ABU6XPF1_9FABA|nr:hypothetical protein [Stylosanthes scabra]